MTIGVDGGTFKITDPQSPIYGLSIEFPGAALSEEVEVSVRVVANPPDLGFNNLIAPISETIDIITSGNNNFNKVVSISIPLFDYSDNNTRIPFALYYDYSNEKWEALKIKSINKNEKTITFNTNHFSTFRIGGINIGNESRFNYETEYQIQNVINYCQTGECDFLQQELYAINPRLNEINTLITQITDQVKVCGDTSYCDTNRFIAWLYRNVENISTYKSDRKIEILKSSINTEGIELDSILINLLGSPCMFCTLENLSSYPEIVDYVIEFWYRNFIRITLEEVFENGICNKDLKEPWDYIDLPVELYGIRGITHIPGNYTKRYVTKGNTCFELNWDFTNTGNSFICSQIPESEFYLAMGITADENYFYVVTGNIQVERYTHSGEFVNILIDRTHLYWAGFTSSGSARDLTVVGNELIISGGPTYNSRNGIIARFNKQTGAFIAEWETSPSFPYGICWVPSISTETFSCNASEGCVIVSQYGTYQDMNSIEHGNGLIYVYSPDGSILYGQLPSTGYAAQTGLDFGIYDTQGNAYDLVLYQKSWIWIATLVL